MEGLTVPDGFAISLFAENLSGARVIEFDPKGRMLISRTREGKISKVEMGTDGRAGKITTLVSGLKNPHGMAWQCADGDATCYLYVAESDALTRYNYDREAGLVSG